MMKTDEWIKALASAQNGACVEVFHRACDSGSCVEVAAMADVVLVRDSKNPDGPRLAFSPEEWHEFVGSVKRGEFG